MFSYPGTRTSTSTRTPALSFLRPGNRTRFSLLLLACLIDAADKSLLAATFKAFETTLQVGPRLLGLLNFYQSISFAVALPAWGLALEHGWEACSLLMLGCYGFGITTCLLALSSSYVLHCGLRILNGGFLCGVIPLSQGILSQIIPEDKRGMAFGCLQSTTALAGLATSYFATTSDTTHWRQSHLTIGAMSVVVGWAIWKFMPPQVSKIVERHEEKDHRGTMTRALHTVKRIFGMKTFCLMVFQGLFGGIPWNAMSFLPMYWQTCGYSDGQAGFLGVSQSLGMAVGGLLGGVIGDYMAKLFPSSGRIITSLVSVAMGIPTFFAIFYVIPCDAEGEHFYLACFLVFVFGTVATWTPASSLRPMCAELMSSPAEQGQIVALWVMLEGITSSVFGSPLVGWLTEIYGYQSTGSVGGSGAHLDAPDLSSTESAGSLGKSLVGVSTMAWIICLLAWICMLKTYPRDKAAADARRQYNSDDQAV